MTKTRITVHVLFGGLFALGVLASVVTLALAIFSVVGWTWFFVALAAMAIGFVVATVNFIGIARNMDATFSDKGIFGRL